MMMIQLNIRHALLLLFLFATWECCNAKPVILVVGDSLSAAYQIEPEKGWVTLLEKKIKTLHPQAIVINSSISGDTTANGLQRLPDLLQQYQPNIVILELGGNDGLRGLPIINMKSNLQKLIKLCIEAKAKVLLVGLRLPPNYGESYIKQFENSYQQLSKEYDIPLVPFILDKIALNPQLLLPDQIHPTAEAQPLVLENIWPFLAPLLPQSSQ